MCLSTGYKLFPFCSWHLNSSTSRSAEQIVLIMRPDAIKQTSVPPPVPPRRKARNAPKPSPRHSRISKNSPENYPCQMDPFETITCCCDQTDRYKSLRRNLARVLEGLQQPLPPATTSLSPFSMSKSYNEDPLDLVEEPALSPPRKVKSRKWTHGLLKRLSKPFVKNSSLPVETKAYGLSSSSSSGYLSNPSQPFWQRLISRNNRKSQFYVPSSSSGSETISSNSCLYAGY